MVIAINTRILSGDSAAAKVLTDYFIRTAAGNPAHQFYFISNNEVSLASSLSNIKHIVLKQQSTSPLLWKLWYNYKLPAVLKKIKADVLVSADGICSLRTKVPQCVFVNELAFLHHPEWYGKNYVSFIKANLPASLLKAKSVFTFSDVVRNEIVSQYSVAEEKIIIASYVGDKKYKAFSGEEKDAVKQKFTGGNEYFLFHGTIHNRSNLTNLLKAFSLFKKRQKSSMQLLLVTDKVPAKNEFVDSLRLYKYRSEVKLLEGLNEKDTVSLTASAWCAVNLSPLYSDIYFLQNALQNEVPVISGRSEQAKELLGNAALYANQASIDSIAEQLMLVYKDEFKRNELMETGKQQNPKSAQNAFWQMIVSVAGSKEKL